MKRFVEGADCRQVTLLPPCLDNYVTEENPVRVVEVFVDKEPPVIYESDCPPYEWYA